MMQVNPIRQSAQSILVEYSDHAGPHRVTVPSSALADSAVNDAELALGIEYGEPWETLLKLRVTPEHIAAELRRRNIWTYEDLMSAPDVAKGAIAAVVGSQFAQLINAARAMHDTEVSNG
jgi:hypothetical protein